MDTIEKDLKKVQRKLTNEINRTKARLIAKAKKTGLYENFGDAEERKLRDKYAEQANPYGGYQTQRTMDEQISSFGRWARNFDLSDL